LKPSGSRGGGELPKLNPLPQSYYRLRSWFLYDLNNQTLDWQGDVLQLYKTNPVSYVGCGPSKENYSNVAYLKVI